MENRVVIASNHRDSHGEVITKSALEKMAETINGPRKVRWTINHKRQLPPLGKAVEARVEEKEGYYYLTIRQVEYDVYEQIDWNNDFIKASFSEDQSPFVEPEFDPPNELELSIDPHNFASRSEYEDYVDSLKSTNNSFDTTEFRRKALLNDSEVVLRIAEYYVIYKSLTFTVDKTIKKVSEKLSTEVAQDSVKIYDLIRTSVKEMIRRTNQKNRRINYVIKFPNKPEIELFARIRDPEVLIKALKGKKIVELKAEIDDISSYTEFEKIQFTLTDKGKWKFNYLLTKKGETIGRKVAFKKRDKVLEYIDKKEKRNSP